MRIRGRCVCHGLGSFEGCEREFDGGRDTGLARLPNGSPSPGPLPGLGDGGLREREGDAGGSELGGVHVYAFCIGELLYAICIPFVHRSSPAQSGDWTGEQEVLDGARLRRRPSTRRSSFSTTSSAWTTSSWET